MVGHAKTTRQIKREAANLKETWMKRAIEIYWQEQQWAKPKSQEAICKQAEEECLHETKKTIKLASSTLDRRVKGGRSHHEARQEQRWLTDEETEVLIQDIILNAQRGFPPNHAWIKEHADRIARARHGNKFPTEGVGPSWTDRFVSDHKARIGAYWAKPLDQSRARAVNPFTKEHYFKLLAEVIEGEGGEDVIPPELIYGTDESGFQKGVGQKTRVFGARGQQSQHQQRSGDRENITVITTICGDGSSVSPAVIFKGEGWLASWKQKNPLNASLTFSKKGYTTGEIARAWLEKNFDKETKAKARGRRRLLLVDGHNSHYTLAVLDYAQGQRIAIVGYPAHGTHIYQGLDVIIFGPMKYNWSVAQDAFERRGHTVNKGNFLEVYDEAHKKTLTPENIRVAFRITGVILLNPDVVTEAQMAPSLVTSTRTTVPVRQCSPIQVMSAMILDYMDHQRAAMSLPESDSTEADGTEADGTEAEAVAQSGTSVPFFVHSAIGELSSTSAGFLTSASPIKTASALPTFKTSTLSPLRPSRYTEILAKPAQTAFEQELKDALQDAEARDSARKEAMLGMQAGVVLVNVYASEVQAQLQAAAERSQKKGKRLMGDGKAKFFSGDEFHALCMEDDEKRREEEAAAEQRKTRRDAHAAELAEWKRRCDAIREKNRERREEFEAALTAWTEEKEAAKREKRRVGWGQPKWKRDFQPERMPERPKRQDDGEEEESDGNEDEGGVGADD